jgi:hypothetical protein
MLSDLLPRPIPISLGVPPGQYLALPLRIQDIADFEALARAGWAHPCDSLPSSLDDSPETRDLLKAAMDVAEQGPPSWGGGCPLPTVGLLHAVLRSHEISDEQAADLATSITPEQWKAVLRVAFGIHPATEMIRTIDNYLNLPQLSGQGMTWAEVACALCERMGYTPDQVGKMTIPCAACLMRGGSPVDPWHFDGEAASPEDTELYHGTIQTARASFFASVNSASPSDNGSEPLPPADSDENADDDQREP